MIPWYIKVIYLFPLILLPAMWFFARKKTKNDNVLILVSLSAMACLITMLFTIPGTLNITGTASAGTAQEAVSKAKAVAAESVPHELRNRARRFVAGGGIGSGYNGIQVMKTREGYRATVTMEVDEYMFDNP